MSTWSTRTKELLKEKNLDQGILGAVTGVSPQAVSKWMKGTSTPSIESLTLIADYLDVSLDYLTGRTDDKSLGQTSTSTSPMVGEVVMVPSQAEEAKGMKSVSYWITKYNESSTRLKECNSRVVLLEQLVEAKDKMISVLERRA